MQLVAEHGAAADQDGLAARSGRDEGVMFGGRRGAEAYHAAATRAGGRKRPCAELWPPAWRPRLLVSSPVSHPELKSFVTGADQRAGASPRAPSAGLAAGQAAILRALLLQPQPSGGHCAAAAGTAAGLELRGCWVDARHVVGKGKEQCKVCCSRGSWLQTGTGCRSSPSLPMRPTLAVCGQPAPRAVPPHQLGRVPRQALCGELGQHRLRSGLGGMHAEVSHALLP